MKRQWEAADRLAQHLRRLGGAPENGALDVTRLAEAFGVQIELTHIEEDGHLAPTISGWQIRCRRDHPPHRQRFTIAHELAHLALRVPTLGGEPAAAATDIGRGGFSSNERLCDCTAAALLMPDSWMRLSFDRVQASQSLSLVMTLATNADVSPAAAFLRLQSIYGWPRVLLAWLRSSRGWTLSTEAGAFTPAADVPRLASWIGIFVTQAYLAAGSRSVPGSEMSEVFSLPLPVSDPDVERYVPAEIAVSRESVYGLIDPSRRVAGPEPTVDEPTLV